MHPLPLSLLPFSLFFLYLEIDTKLWIKSTSGKQNNTITRKSPIDEVFGFVMWYTDKQHNIRVAHRSLFHFQRIIIYIYNVKCINLQKFRGGTFCQNCDLRTSLLNNCTPIEIYNYDYTRNDNAYKSIYIYMSSTTHYRYYAASDAHYRKRRGETMLSVDCSSFSGFIPPHVCLRL